MSDKNFGGMSDEQLGQFVRATVVRCAVDVWHAGEALMTVQDRRKKDGTWTAWLDAYFPLSEATAFRWIAVRTKIELADIESGLSLTEAYKRIGLAKTRKKKPAGEKPAPKVTFSAVLEAPEEHREAVLSRAAEKAGLKLSAVEVHHLLEAIEEEWKAELRGLEKEFVAVKKAKG